MALLKNGSTLLLELPTQDGAAVVLAQTETAFATWRRDDQGDTYHGEYFAPTVEGLKGAIENLEERAAQ